MSASGALVDEVQAARDHAVSGRYEESQAAYEHAIAQIQSLVTAGTGRPWEAVQVELTKESLLVRETALVTSILRELVVLHPRCQHCDEKRGLAR